MIHENRWNLSSRKTAVLELVSLEQRSMISCINTTKTAPAGLAPFKLRIQLWSGIMIELIYLSDDQTNNSQVVGVEWYRKQHIYVVTHFLPIAMTKKYTTVQVWMGVN